MPYIDDTERDRAAQYPQTVGELNFAFSNLANDFVLAHGLSYSVCNDVMGALAGAQAEFYRRVVAPYEETKMALVGEVFTCLEPEPLSLTNADLDALAIHDEGTGQTWFRCSEDPCDLHLVGKGHVACSFCEAEKQDIPLSELGFTD